ncbi:MAG TPA: guanylate cyclase, partial [Reyranella sp.]|nr:guanylate cyclase [Reyranella sp.]
TVAPPGRDAPESSTAPGGIAHWFANLPRPLAVALTVSAFLIVINLFSNPHRIWFHWPVALLLFGGIMRTVLRRRRDDR